MTIRNKMAGILVLFSTTCAVLALHSSAASASPLSVKTVTGDESTGSLANSFLIEGKHSVLLVDAQRTVNNADKVVSAIKNTGKELTWVFITHAHPDHFLGAAVIKKAFPHARFISTPDVVQILRRDGEAMRQFVGHALEAAKSGDHVPDAIVIPESIAEAQFEFEGRSFKIIKANRTESESAALIFDPQSRTLLAGDLLFNRVHMWLHDGRIKQWKTSLTKLKTLGQIDMIYPGHGMPDGSSLIDANLRYLEDFDRTVHTLNDVTDATAEIKKLYPSYKMERFLSYGLSAVLEKMR